MKQTIRTKTLSALALTCLGASLPLHAATIVNGTTLIDGFSSTASGGLNQSNIDGNWHGNLTPWSIASSTLTHAPSGPTYNGADEGIVGQIIVPAAGSDVIEISFDYNVGTGNTLYVHLRGFDATGASPTWSINAGAQNGNAWDSSADATVYNLWDGITLPLSGDANSGGGDEAVSLTGSGTYTASIDISGYAVADVADYEYLMLGFAANATTDNTSTVGNLALCVPEPSSTALLGLSGLAFVLRRRK